MLASRLLEDVLQSPAFELEETFTSPWCNVRHRSIFWRTMVWLGHSSSHRLTARTLGARELTSDGSVNLRVRQPFQESLSLGVLFPYDVSERRAATNAGFASPSCAAPSGFLSLLTHCSALLRTALFHAESVLGVEALRGFPLPVAATTFVALCPDAVTTPADDR